MKPTPFCSFVAGFPLCVVVACIVLSGCASDTLFRADFDSDTAGVKPNSSPPGPPTGDEISLSDPNDSSVQLAVMNCASAFGSQCVRYSNIDVAVPYRFASFLSRAETIGSTQKFRATWVGRVDLSPSGSLLDIWLGDPGYQAIAAIRFDNGQVLLRTSNNPEQYEVLGSYSETVNHAVFITVDKGTKQYSVVMTPNSVQSGWRDALNNQALETNRPTLHFLFSEPANSTASYVADDIVITKID